MLNPSSLVFGGRIPDGITRLLKRKNSFPRLHEAREELAIKNAVPTAEGVRLK